QTSSRETPATPLSVLLPGPRSGALTRFQASPQPGVPVAVGVLVPVGVDVEGPPGVMVGVLVGVSVGVKVRVGAVVGQLVRVGVASMISTPASTCLAGVLTAASPKAITDSASTPGK